MSGLDVIGGNPGVHEIMEELNNLWRELGNIRRNITIEVDAKVAKSFGDKIDMIDAALRESILQKEILIAKGFMTRGEINAKYEELKRG